MSSSKPIELHVWSPAFDLPSLDPECLAAIAYFNVALPKQYWVLVESNNTSISPNGALPAIKDDGEWVAGFDRIVAHIRAKSNGNVNLDKGLSSKDQALSTALSSLIQRHALPLLALSLYVSPQNFASVRPIYSLFLPFPLQYHIPVEHHRLAVQRTSHLKWASSTYDYYDQDDLPVSTSFANLSVPSMSSAEKNEPAGERITTRVRMERLVRDFLEDIDVQLGSNDYLFGDGGPTSADCYLAGYLSFFVYPELPYPWLAEITRRDFPTVCEYVERMRAHAFPSNEDLPWVKSDPADALSPGSWIMDNVKGYFGGGSRGQRANQVPSSIRWQPFARAIGGAIGAAGIAFIVRREGVWPAWLPFPLETKPGDAVRVEQPETPNPAELEYDISADNILGIRREQDLSADSFLGIRR